MKEFGTDGGTIHKNCYAQLCELDGEETKKIEIAAVGAGLGAGFDHTSKLKVMAQNEKRK